MDRDKKIKMAQELIQLSDKEYIWQPIYGKEYFLGYNDGREQRGYFFGSNGKDFVFYNDKTNNLQAYLSKVESLAIWFLDGCDEPSYPGFEIHTKQTIIDSLEIKIILDTIKKMKHREKIRIKNLLNTLNN